MAGPFDRGPYREAPPATRHVCLDCFRTYSLGPADCRRCGIPRVPVDLDVVYEELLAEAHRRFQAPRFHLAASTEDHGGPRRIPHSSPPTDRPIEEYGGDELVDWLGMRPW